MANLLRLHSEPHTRRRKSIRGTYAPRSVLGLPAPVANKAPERTAAFDVAGALEARLDRYSTKEQFWGLLTQWLDAAKREELAARYPDYVTALERALVVMSKAPSREHGIAALRRR